MTYFIMGGAMRSGTTILNNILCSADDTNPQLAECGLLTNITRVYAQMKGSFDVFMASYFDDFKEYQNLFRSWLEDFLDHTLKKYEAEHLVLKSPEITPLIPDLRELLGNKAKFIVSIRDPRATVTSMLKVGERLQNKNIQNQMAALSHSRNIAAFSQMYNNYYARLFASLTPELKENLLFIRYEDVVQNLPEVIKALENFTGLKLNYDPSSSWKNMDKKTFEKIENNAFAMAFDSGLHRKPLSSEALEKYKEVLSEAEINTVNQHCAKMMQMFHYA